MNTLNLYIASNSHLIITYNNFNSNYSMRDASIFPRIKKVASIYRMKGHREVVYTCKQLKVCTFILALIHVSTFILPLEWTHKVQMRKSLYIAMIFWQHFSHYHHYEHQLCIPKDKIWIQNMNTNGRWEMVWQIIWNK